VRYSLCLRGNNTDKTCLRTEEVPFPPDGISNRRNEKGHGVELHNLSVKMLISNNTAISSRKIRWTRLGETTNEHLIVDNLKGRKSLAYQGGRRDESRHT
jgi:hypothetical protein